MLHILLGWKQCWYWAFKWSTLFTCFRRKEDVWELYVFMSPTGW